MRALLRGLAVFTLLVLGGCESTADNTTNVSPEISRVQKQLAVIGYDPGPADGVMGGRTKKAIQHFQIDADLSPNGRVTPQLKEKLAVAHDRHIANARAERAKARKSARAAATDPVGASVRPPLYEVGDSFVWSDGRSETVSRIGAGLIQLDANDGDELTMQGNFILPPQSWEIGGVTGRTEIDKAPAAAWPGRVGKDSNFSVKAVIQSPGAPVGDEWSGEWHCMAKGREKVPVPAGTFNAYVIVCERKDPSPGTWIRRTWHYAPDVNHFVRFLEVLHPSKKRRGKELVAVRPGNEGWPPAARAGLDRAIQEALKRKPGSQPVEWSSSAVSGSFRIEATGRRKLAEGVRCRTYRVVRQGPGPQRHYPGIACRASDTARWLVPGLDEGSLRPEALYRR